MATKMRKSKKRNCIKLVVKEEKEVMATKMNKSKKRNRVKLVV